MTRVDTHGSASMGEESPLEPPDPTGGSDHVVEMNRGLTEERAEAMDAQATGGDIFIVRRVRQYGSSSQAPYVVYLRARQKHSLNVPRVSSELFNEYDSIEKVPPVNRDKLRIFFKIKEQANMLVVNKKFCEKFFVYIPAKDVEISGKILMNDCANAYQILESGYGILDGIDEKIKLVDTSRLVKKIMINNEEKMARTPFIRVSFEGTVLPDYVVMDKLRIPVSPYAPRVMQCNICLKLGHSELHCGNRKRCERCGLNHEEGKNTFPCIEGVYHCPNCKATYKEKSHVCPRIDEIKDAAVDRAIATRHKAKSSRLNGKDAPQTKMGWQTKRNVVPKSIYDKEYPAIKTRNRFNGMPIEEELISESSAEENDPMEGSSRDNVRKRKNSLNGESEDENIWFKWAENHDRIHGRKSARVESPPVTIGEKQKNFSSKDTQKGTSLSSSIGWNDIIRWILQKLGLNDDLLRMVETVIIPLIEQIWPKQCVSLLNNHGQ